MKSKFMSKLMDRLKSDMPNTFSVLPSVEHWARTRQKKLHDERLSAAVRKAKPYVAYFLVGALMPTGDRRKQVS